MKTIIRSRKKSIRNIIIGTLITMNLFSLMTYANTVEEFRNKLNSSSSIVLKEQVVSLNEQYYVYIGKEKVGELNGKYISLTGDTFTLTDENGNKIAAEKQIKRWNIKFNRMAEVFDQNGQTAGFIGEEVIKDMFKVGTSFHFFDINKNEVAELRQQFFSIMPKYVIKDEDGNKLYTIKKKIYWKSKYELEIHDSSVVPVEQAIFITSIINEIKQAQSKENNN